MAAAGSLAASRVKRFAKSGPLRDVILREQRLHRVWTGYMKSRVRIDTVGPAVQNRPPSHTHTAPGQPPLTRKGSLRSRKSRPFELSVMLVIVLGTATGSSASSQTLTGPAAISLGAQPGARVRVVESASAATSQIGTVAAVGQDGITIR